MRPPVPHVAAQARRSGGHDLGGGRGLRWLCLLARVPERIQQVRTSQDSQVVEVTVQHNLAPVGNCTAASSASQPHPLEPGLWRPLHRMQGVA